MMLNDIEWKAVKFKELFEDIYIAKSTDLVDIPNGDIPFIGRSSTNNGFQGEFDIDISKLNKRNSITVGMVGEPIAFYQKYDFACSQNVLVLRDEKLNEYNALFLCSLINKYLKLKNYNYGYPVSKERFKKDKIIVPINSKGKPNYDFMEKFIKNKKEICEGKFKKYINNKLYNLKKEYKDICTQSITWKNYPINMVCDIFSGHDIYDAERVEGNIPYITSTSANNGIKYYISNTNSTLEENAISVNRNGSVGYAFYHKYKALYSNDCRKLKLKKYNNEFVSLFITNQIMAQKEKYSYGYKLGTGRLKRQYILLPTKNDKIDYDYMENYIKLLEINKLEKCVKYFNIVDQQV